MNDEPQASKFIYAGLFLVALATTLLELLLTRIWSVAAWYHFAFAAVSLALFGITGGALLVYLLPEFFRKEQIQSRLALAALLFSVSIVIGLLAQLNIPFCPDKSLTGLGTLVVLCCAAGLPFLFSGVCVALALTKFPDNVSKLYAFDLCGAAVGCLGMLAVLQIADAPTAVVVASLWAGVGALCFAQAGGSGKLKNAAMVISLSLALGAIANTYLAEKQSSLLRLVWAKGKVEERPLYEKWNSFSRITVSGNPALPEEPEFWGRSPVCPKDLRVRQLHINLDAQSGTAIPHFAGDLKEVDYLKYDLANLVYFLRKNARVLVIGMGGGPGVLSALLFHEKSVVAVEINEDVLKAVTGKFGDFSGHLDRDPRLTLVNDEARSYTARQKPGFDIIEMTVITTAMATGTGAYALTENSLYTVEAWKTFLEKLAPDGILSCTRWYFTNRPADVYRIVALARAALIADGVPEPSKCLAVVRQQINPGDPAVCATILVSKKPFSTEDLLELKQTADRFKFDIVVSPSAGSDSTLKGIAAGLESGASVPFNIAPPTDDNPFFFYLLKPWQALSNRGGLHEIKDLSTKAEMILLELALVVVCVTAAVMLLPLFLAGFKKDYRNGLPLLFYFTLIGLGYMFVEVSQLQRLIIFLGHPSYSLTVVLFTLLISSGLGSFLSGMERWRPRPQQFLGRFSSAISIACLLVLLILLLAYAFVTPFLLAKFAASTTPTRILVAATTLFPIGLFMGMPMPFGLKIASRRFPNLTPWLWAVNGAASVCASVLTMVIAVSVGISAAFAAGGFCYLAALVSLAMANLDGKHGEQCN